MAFQELLLQVLSRRYEMGVTDASPVVAACERLAELVPSSTVPLTTLSLLREQDGDPLTPAQTSRLLACLDRFPDTAPSLVATALADPEADPTKVAATLDAALASDGQCLAAIAAAATTAVGRCDAVRALDLVAQGRKVVAARESRSLRKLWQGQLATLRDAFAEAALLSGPRM